MRRPPRTGAARRRHSTLPTRRPRGSVIVVRTCHPASGRSPKSTTVVHRIEPRAAADIEIAGDTHIGDVDTWPRFDPHGAVETGHPPLVLVLDVAVGAVPDHDDRQFVRRRAARASSRRTRSAACCRFRSRRTSPLTYTACTLSAPATWSTVRRVRPRRRHVERSSVHPRHVAVGQPRRRTVERHLDVGVVRHVDEPPRSCIVQLPGTATVDGPPAPAGDRRLGHGVGVVEQLERPGPVELAPHEPAERNVHGQPVDLEQRRIGPGADRADHRQHDEPLMRRIAGAGPLPRARPG